MHDAAIQLIQGARFPGSSTVADVWIGGDGVISAVTPAGALTELDGVSAASARTLRADGRVLTSGLWDEHVHLGQWAQQSSRPDFVTADSPAAALELAAGYLAPDLSGSTPTELIGMRVRGGDWGGLSREQLDSVSSRVPIVLVGLDLHGAWLNSAALAKYGFSPDHSAHVVEDECFGLVAELDRTTDEALDAAVDLAARRAAALGVVGVVDFEIRWSFDDWTRRELGGFRALRVESAIYPEHLDRAIDCGLGSGSPIGTNGLVSVGPLKVITDGSLGTRTALCCEPYAGGGHGRELVAPAELSSLLARAKRAGYWAAVHAIGDRANAQALDAFGATGAVGRIEHAQLLRSSDIARFAALGVGASVQPAHLIDDVPSMRAEWADRADRAFPLASLLASGANVVLGSDAPVAPLDPWHAIAAAVTRARAGSPAWVPEERISVAAALACSMRGPLAPGVGDHADLVLLDSDPLTAAPPIGPAGFRPPGVAATLLGGVPTHLTADLAHTATGELA